MKKNVSRFFLIIRFSGILIALFFFFGCELSEPVSRENLANAQSEDTQIESKAVDDWHVISEYQLFDQYNCTGSRFVIYMYAKGDQYCLGNTGNVDLDDFRTSNWDNKVKSIRLVNCGAYPAIYVFEDPHTPGGWGKVMKIVAHAPNNIPAGFGISSVLPEVPQYAAAKQTVRIMVDPCISRLRFLGAENEPERPIKPKRTSPDLLETTFYISYIDVNRKFFTLQSLANNAYVCTDLLKDPTSAPLHANRYSANYWEIFKIRYIFYEDPGYRDVMFSALANTKIVRAISENYPIGTYNYGESRFYIMDITL